MKFATSRRMTAGAAVLAVAGAAAGGAIAQADNAAPVAHAVLDTYYKKKTGQFDGKLATIAAK